MNWKGPWSSSTAYAINDAVSSGGSSYICIAANTNNVPPNPTYWNLVAQIGNTGLQGPTGATGSQGPAGSTGPAGTAATIAVGTTSTLTPGNNATVTNSGTSSTAVFNFGIPQGATGSTGAAGANAYTVTATSSFIVPAVGSTVVVTVTDGSWVIAGQVVNVAGAAGSGVAGAFQVQSVSGNQLTLLNPTPAPAIPLADSTQNGLLNQLSGNTTDFVDGTNTCRNLVNALVGLLVPTGTVLDFAGSTAPTGFVLCNGASYATTGAMAALFAVVGYTYGGSGANFNVPDLRGRTSFGAGQGTGLTNRTLAASGGEESHTQAIAELPAHSHTASQGTHTHSDAGHLHQIFGLVQGGAGGTATNVGSGSTNTNTGYASIQAASAGAITIANTGSGTPFNVMPPFVALNKIIKT
jgi:microcystin-dependent protein